MSKLMIELIQEGEVYAAFHPESPKEAKQLYYKHAALPGQYTRLTVGARQLTTAQAERYLGPQKAKGIALPDRKGRGRSY